jgi:hypothetical protein
MSGEKRSLIYLVFVNHAEIARTEAVQLRPYIIVPAAPTVQLSDPYYGDSIGCN